MKTWLRICAAVLIAAAIVAAIVFVPAFKRNIAQLLDWVRDSGPAAPLLFGGLYVIAVVAFLPGSVLTIGAGFVLGLAVGTVTVSLASTLGAAAAFLLGRTIARTWVERRVARLPRFQALDQAIRQQGFKIVLLLRLSPVFPFNLLNYALGLTAIGFRQYVLASWIGMLPATVVYVYLGSTLKSAADVATGKPEALPGQKALFAAGLVATIVLMIFLTRLARHALARATKSSEC
jgi:uncharacterized membrane protein YdjX (TVP38/TMEM64 family)